MEPKGGRVTTRCNRRDFLRGRWLEPTARAPRETPSSFADALPPDFSPALLRLEASRLGYDPDRLSAEELEKIVKRALQAERQT